eukprot:2876592-Rhodomonas_salina.2
MARHGGNLQGETGQNDTQRNQMQSSDAAVLVQFARRHARKGIVGGVRPGAEQCARPPGPPACPRTAPSPASHIHTRDLSPGLRVT